MPIKNDIPTIIVGNFAEAHIDFLGRCADTLERTELILGETYHADRILLWAGDPKLVIVSYEIAHADLICQRLNYLSTIHVCPQNPTHYLSKDILREAHLMKQISNYAGENRVVQIIPYATTPEFLELADVLRYEYGLDVRLPESPELKDFWIRDYIDTKNGYRILASTWLSDVEDFIPFGVTCYDFEHATRVAEWFNSRGETCLLKPDTGESGIGAIIVNPVRKDMDAQKRFEKTSYFGDELIVVERYIPSSQQISPSLEIKVPHLGEGKPEVTYVSQQIFLGFGDFCGIQINKKLYESVWYPKLESRGLLIANKLQEIGYVGHFDLDCVLGDDGRLYILELNARRTGGTHVHEFASHFYGDDYVDKVSLVSYESMDSGAITDTQELVDVLLDNLLPSNGNDRYGVIITITNTLRNHQFGCITVAPDIEEALALRDKVADKIKQYSKSKA